MKKFAVMCVLIVACKDDARVDALEKRVEALEKRPAPAAARQQPDPNAVVNIPVHAEDVTRGKGKVVIVEAFDFACTPTRRPLPPSRRAQRRSRTKVPPSSRRSGRRRGPTIA